MPATLLSVLLFSFELCLKMLEELAACYRFGILLFSFELCHPEGRHPSGSCYVLLFSFELCSNFNACCYTLFNVKLLFSFELCEAGRTGWRCKAEGWSFGELLFSFELCRGDSGGRVGREQYTRRLLFSFELCLSPLHIGERCAENCDCYFLLNYAHDEKPSPPQLLAILNCYFLLNYAGSRGTKRRRRLWGGCLIAIFFWIMQKQRMWAGEEGRL